MTSPDDVIARLRAALGFIERDVRVGELTDDELAHIARFMEIAADSMSMVAADIGRRIRARSTQDKTPPKSLPD